MVGSSRRGNGYKIQILDKRRFYAERCSFLSMTVVREDQNLTADRIV